MDPYTYISKLQMQKNPNVFVKQEKKNQQKQQQQQQQQQSRSKKHTIPCESFSQEILVPNKKKILVLLPLLLLLLLLLPVIIMILQMLFLFCQLQIASLHSVLPFPLPPLRKQHKLFLSRKHSSLSLDTQCGVAAAKLSVA